jgi:hypothetical protein
MSTYPRIPRRGGAHSATGCTGACDQGRRQCATPEACQQPAYEEGDGLDAARGIVLAVGVVCAAIAAVSLIVGLL